MSDILSLQQVKRPQLQGHQVQYSNVHHMVIIDGALVPCSPTEYRLLMRLLYRAGEAEPYDRLLGKPGQQPLTRSDRRSLTQYMSRLRARLWPFGLEINCLTGYGYLLLSKPNGQEEDK